MVGKLHLVALKLQYLKQTAFTFGNFQSLWGSTKLRNTKDKYTIKNIPKQRTTKQKSVNSAQVI